MSETRKLATILCSDVVGYSRLAGAGRGPHSGAALRSDLIDPTIAVHNGRVVKRILALAARAASQPRPAPPPALAESPTMN